MNPTVSVIVSSYNYGPSTCRRRDPCRASAPKSRGSSAADNSPLKQRGLYYYYHTMAKCLDALGVDEFTDAAGKKHDWRAELTDALAKRQRKDGSWVNDKDQWMEGDPNAVDSQNGRSGLVFELTLGQNRCSYTALFSGATAQRSRPQ